MVVAVVDDHRLISLLAAPEPPTGRYATTCSWWWRLTSALSGHRRGALSSRLEEFDHSVSSAIRTTVQDLPERLVIVDLRQLIPAMGVLAQSHVVNQLAAEAVAAAAYLRAPIEVEVDSHLLRAAAYAENIAYRVV